MLKFRRIDWNLNYARHNEKYCLVSEIFMFHDKCYGYVQKSRKVFIHKTIDYPLNRFDNFNCSLALLITWAMVCSPSGVSSCLMPTRDVSEPASFSIRILGVSINEICQSIISSTNQSKSSIDNHYYHSFINQSIIIQQIVDRPMKIDPSKLTLHHTAHRPP